MQYESAARRDMARAREAGGRRAAPERRMRRQSGRIAAAAPGRRACGAAGLRACARDVQIAPRDWFLRVQIHANAQALRRADAARAAGAGGEIW